ncbi:MAG: beta-lactamase family protein [Gemmatimonadota bacterium]|nr:beta-lactamase family protein [Gemmatimonadota bacterium]MDH3422555.1 beta-lactamase family protein [Gemmatimonadota bacterium]
MTRLHRPFSVALALVIATVLAPAQAYTQAYPHATESIGTVREIYDGVLSPDMAVTTFRNIDRLFPSRVIPRSTRPRALRPAVQPLTSVTVSDDGARYSLAQFMELNRVAGLLILQDGQIKLERYRFGNTERTRWMSMSVAKSVTSTLFGAALEDGYILSLADPVVGYVPSLAGSAYEGASVRDVLMMSSGVRWRETYTDPTSDRRRLLEAQIAQRPGGAVEVMRALPRAAAPGTVNTYSTGETQVAGEVLYRALGGPLSNYLHDEIWEPYGMEADATWWLESPGGVEIGGSGFSAVLRDYGRLGQFILEDGVIDGVRVLPEGWVREASTPKVLTGGTPLDYGYLWWTGTSEAERRDGAFSGEGIHGQFLYINPAVNVVIVIWSARPLPSGGAVVDEWAFFSAVSDALRSR